MSSDETYYLTVEADSPITLTRDWMDASTTRDPNDQDPEGEVTFPVIEGGYYLSADGYEEMHVEEVTEDMTVSLVPEGDDEEENEEDLGEYEQTGEDLDNELDAVKDRLDTLEASGGGGSGDGQLQDELEELQNRIAALEEAGGGSGGDGQFQDELDEIQDRIAALEQSSGGGGGEELRDDVSDLEERISAIEESGGGGGGGEGLINIENLAAALRPHLESSGDIPDDIEESLSRIDQAIEDLSVASGEAQSRLDALEEAVASIEAGSGRSDEQIRQLIREYVDEHVEAGGMTREEVESVVTAALADLDIEGFDQEVIERVSYHADALDFPARKVGPSEPIGEYHGVDMWGVKFATGTSCHIHEATVDAAESGSFRVVLGETDGVDQFDEVDSTEVEVEEGVQRVDLDLEVPSSGYYLLSREGVLGLRRGEFGGWDDYMVDNLRLARGDKPGFPENDNWYYFFDMEMTASKDHEFPD